MSEVTNREIVRKLLYNAIQAVKSKADIEAIEHSNAFYGVDAGEHALKLLSIYGSPTYGNGGEVVGYEMNVNNDVIGMKNKIDIKT